MKTILIVDDEDAVRSIVTRILRRQNYAVLEADGAQSAVELARSHREQIDLLITDMQMPGAGGPEVAQKLAEGRPGLKVLFMSGYSDQGAPGARIPSGANFLQKPFSSRELTAAVTAAVGPA